jgi:hypothetical protein
VAIASTQTAGFKFMYRPRFLLHIAVLTGLFPSVGPTPGRPVSPGIAISDFLYLDTSGEPTDQTAAHQRRLRAFVAALRRDVGTDGTYRLIPSPCATPCNDDEIHAAAKAGADILIMGAVKKLSTLVLWAKVTAIDANSQRAIFDRLVTFRGDNDTAWEQAEAFIARDMRKALAAPAAAAAPTPLAVFDFELEDESAAAASTGETASDLTQLAAATNEVRTLLAQSGRYRLVDVASPDADSVKSHPLRDCDGCDAALARKSGAEQSMVGVVRRVSRMEYTVRFKLRDASTGALLSEGDSGLRMGANYSWSRGAVRLVNDRVIERQIPR